MGITRVRYRERQRLTAADLRSEQSYRLGMAGRHHLGPHEWGVIRGLRVVRVESGAFRLMPGVAIDGYGREVLVPLPVDLRIADFAESQCWFVYVYYCEDPEQVPPGRACRDAPAPRIRQRTAIRVETTLFAPPDLAADLSSARAAGTIPGADPWPILVARIGKGCPPPTERNAPLIDYSLVTHVSHRAARVVAPTDNAVLQLGLESLMDVYHFLVSTRDTKRVLNKRLGIDRDRTLHVWRPLVVAGAEGYGEANLGDGVALQISMPMPAGLDRTLRIDGRIDPELRKLSASLFELGRMPRDAPPVLFKDESLAGRIVPLKFGTLSAASVSVLDTAKASVLTFGAARKKFRQIQRVGARDTKSEPQPAADVAFSIELGRTGGRLSLIAAEPTNDAEEVPCGDVARTRGSLSPSTGMVLLRPAAAIDADPSRREIHAVVTSAPTDSVPKTELRISGGGADDSDASGRLSVGAQTDAGHVAAMRMDGGRRIRLLAGPDVTTPQPLLDVKGTAYLPPIGKNDALLTDLMALAYMSGLFQIGNADTRFDIEVASRLADGYTYDITLKTSVASFTIKRALELIVGKDGPADMSVRALVEIPPGAPKVDPNTPVAVPGLAPSGRNVSILVLMLIKSGNATRVVYSTNPLALVIP
jgi:hypothetical protein